MEGITQEGKLTGDHLRGAYQRNISLNLVYKKYYVINA